MPILLIMSKTLIEFALLAAKKAGIEPTDPRLQALNENAALAKINVDDEVFNAVDTELISFSEAKSHKGIMSEIAAKVRSEVWDGFDKNIIPETLTKLGIDQSALADILATEKGHKKIGTLMEKIAELTSAKAKATSGGDKAELVKQLEALNNQLVAEKQKFDQEKQSILSQSSQEIYDFALTSKLANKNFVLKDVGNDVNLLTSKTLINSELQAKGAKAVYDKATNSFKLVKAADPEVPYYENNKEVDFDSFTDRVLLEKKVIGPNNPPPPPAPPRGGNPPPQPPADMSGFQQKLKERSEAFEKGSHS